MIEYLLDIGIQSIRVISRFNLLLILFRMQFTIRMQLNGFILDNMIEVIANLIKYKRGVFIVK